MDVWTHPASAALRAAADEVLAAAEAALRMGRADRKQRGRRGSRGSPASDSSSPRHSPSPKASPGLWRSSKGSPLTKSDGTRSSPGAPRGSRRAPSPADLELGPAATPTATATATAQLHKLDVRALQKKARAVGCDAEELAKVVAGVRSFGRGSDAGSLGYSPKHALIDLIRAKTDTPCKRPAARALTTSSLHKLSVRALRQRARDLGVAEDELTEIVEGSSPKRALIAVIEANSPAALAPELQPQPEPDPEPEPDVEQEEEPEPAAQQEAASGPHVSVNQWRSAWPSEQLSDRCRRLEVLPPRLLAALQAVESVDVDASSHSTRSSNCTKQLRQLKQTYAADLMGALAQVEAALASARAMSHVTQEHLSDERHGETMQNLTSPTLSSSMLETIAGEVLGDRVLPALAAVDLARLGQSCRTLQALVRSSELEYVWEAHYHSRWRNSSPARGVTPMLEYSHRANVELAWRSTSWVGMDSPQGICQQPSTVEPTAVLLQGPQHDVCAVAFDLERKNAATGDTDGVVRIWDVAQSLRGAKQHQNGNEFNRDGKVGASRSHGRRSVGADSGLGRTARLAVLRLHKKGHPVRWMAMHGRRLLCSCASAMHNNANSASGDHSAAVAPGRLVLVDLDDLERQQNNSMLTKGVAAAAIDTSCGFIGTGLQGERVSGGQDMANGFPVHIGWAGVGGALAQFDLRLDRAERVPAPAPLPPVSSVVITTHYEDCVDAAIPLLGLGDLGYQTAAVATTAGVVCTVDLNDNEVANNHAAARNNDIHAGAENSDNEEEGEEDAADQPRAQRILRRWPAPADVDGTIRLGHSALAAVPSASALVATWYPHEALLLPDRQFGTLRVFDPRQDKPIACMGSAEACPPISDLFAPPGSSQPTVLAMLCSGEVQSIDLRMLDKGLVTEVAGSAGLRAPQEWASVATASKDVAESLECVLPRRLSGGSANLIATVHGGALLGEFGKVLEGEHADQPWETGGHQTPLGKERKERKDKKGSKRGEAVNNGRRRFPKKNNRRKQ